MEIFHIGFLSVRLLDIIDILLVAFLLYKLYDLLKGGVAMNILIGLISIYVLWWLCARVLNMQLLGALLGQFIGVGVIALIIVFQQEVRRFLVLLGTNSFVSNNKLTKRLFNWNYQYQKQSSTNIAPVVGACSNMSKNRTGAIIILARNTDLKFYAQTGDLMDADVWLIGTPFKPTEN